MTSSASPPGGRRANGLPAAEWGALVDVDPRLSEALLDRLAAAGVAAYVEPAGGTADPASRAVLLPKRPMDRLWVDPSRADDARAVVTAEVADLTALLAEEDPTANAHGFVQAVPGTAAARVLAPPDLPDRVVKPVTPQPPLDDDALFRQIIEGFDLDYGSPVTPWPVSEDLSEPTAGRPDLPAPPAPPAAPGPPGAPTPPADEARGRSLRRRTDPPLGEGALPGWLEPDALEDEGHFEPPLPPPAPRFQARTVGCVLAIVGGLLLTFAPNVFGLYESPGLGLVGILCFVGGAGSLVWSMREASDDDPDDGAVL